jgi:hypothetical protein
MHEKIKEACTKAQDSFDNSNGSQEREKPWEVATKSVVRFLPIPSFYGYVGDFFDVSGKVCYHLSVVISLKALNH